MVDLIRVMVNAVKVPLHEAIAMATVNPASALGSSKGRIEVGADADFVILSPKLEVMKTFVGGKRVY